MRTIQQHVLVTEQKEKTKTTPGGIELPDISEENVQYGKVVSVGKGRTLSNGQREHMDVSEKDVVGFGRHAGVRFERDGVKYIVLRQEEIMFVED